MKKKVIGFLVLAAILLIAAAIVIIVNLKLDSEKSKTKMNLYFFSEQKTAIVPEEREIEYDEESELIRKSLWMDLQINDFNVSFLRKHGFCV